MSAPSILGALELPRGIAWVVKMILIQSRRPIVPVELELNLHLVVRQRFPTERARPSRLVMNLAFRWKTNRFPSLRR
jgi:hypothetical protein